MNIRFRKFLPLNLYCSKKDKMLMDAIQNIVGHKPLNASLYRLVTQHSSIAKENTRGFKESNERLEYLGDAILGAIVAEYLFKKYPFKDEGFLTEIRSRIVNRESLNSIAIKIGLNKLIEYNSKHNNRPSSYKSIFGDTLESLVGAVYLDRGYAVCKKFVINKLVKNHIDIEDLINNNTNFKSRVIEWAHREKKHLEFKTTEVKEHNNFKEFSVELYLNGESIAKGKGFNKKKAEQNAASKAIEKFGVE